MLDNFTRNILNTGRVYIFPFTAKNVFIILCALYNGYTRNISAQLLLMTANILVKLVYNFTSLLSGLVNDNSVVNLGYSFTLNELFKEKTFCVFIFARYSTDMKLHKYINSGGAA